MSKIIFILQILTVFCFGDVVLDDQVLTGKLPNGFTYYIRENHYPAKRAALQLFVKVGSLHEKDEEKGIAHFVEHLLFRGTKHFSEGKIDRYMESIGSQRGADSNATTTFDHTVYKFDIPLEKGNSLEKTLLILSDFASFATLSDGAIEKEKTIVLDELHMSTSNAEWKLFKHLMESFLGATLYPTHFPIGEKNIIQQANPQVIRDFYHRWYRPDRMAIVVVGDFDAAAVQNQIEKLFGAIPCPEEECVEPVEFDKLPEEPEAVIHYDPELTLTRISLNNFHSISTDEELSEDKVKNGLIQSILDLLIEERFRDLIFQPEPSILGVGTNSETFSEKLSAYTISLNLIEDRALSGLRSIMQEIHNILEFGFSEAEWQKILRELKISYQKELDNLDKMKHKKFISICKDHFLSNRPIVSKQWRLENSLKLLNTLTIEEINSHLTSSELNGPFMVFLSTPSVSLIQKVGTERLLEIVTSEYTPDSKMQKEPTPFLFESELPSGKISNAVHDDELDVSTWTLNNGVKIILKRTELQKDEILIEGNAIGGISSLEKEEAHSAGFAPAYQLLSGLNGLTYTELTKFLESKGVSIDIDIGATLRSFSLYGNQENAELLFQLLHLFFTSATFENTAWDTLLLRYNEGTKQRFNDPSTLFQEHLRKTNTGDFFLFQRPDALLANQTTSQALFKRFFGSPQDFTFVIVGDFDPSTISELTQKYLASIPSVPKTPVYNPKIPNLFPEKIIRDEFRKGNQTNVTTVITFPCFMPLQNSYAFGAAEKILEQRLTELLREKMGSTYGVWVNTDTPFYPEVHNSTISIGFTSQQEDYKKMVDLVLQEIETLKSTQPAPEEISTIQELYRESRKRNALSNFYWVNQIFRSQHLSTPLKELVDFEPLISAITPQATQEAAQILFASPTHTVITHLPE